jgi:hypothetical protein
LQPWWQGEAEYLVALAIRFEGICFGRLVVSIAHSREQGPDLRVFGFAEFRTIALRSKGTPGNAASRNLTKIWSWPVAGGSVSGVGGAIGGMVSGSGAGFRFRFCILVLSVERLLILPFQYG